MSDDQYKVALGRLLSAIQRCGPGVACCETPINQLHSEWREIPAFRDAQALLAETSRQEAA